MFGKTTIPFKINIRNIPRLIFVGFTTILLILYPKYYINGRNYGYFPTISETAIGDTNTQFFSASMAVNGFFVYITFYLIIIWGEVFHMLPKWLIFIAQALSYICPIMMIGLAVLPIDVSIQGHVLNAVPFFFLVLAFCITIVIVLWKHMNGYIFWVRIAIISFSIISYLCMTYIGKFVPPQNKLTIIAIFEVAYLISQSLLMGTFTHEIEAVEADFFIYDDEK